MQIFKRISLSVLYISFLILLDFALIAKIAYSNTLINYARQEGSKVISANNKHVLASTSAPSPTVIPVNAFSLLPTLKPSPTFEPTTTPNLPTSTPKAELIQTSEDNAVLNAINTYRQKKGVSALSVDRNLQNFAQSRAEYFDARGGMDSHAGFQEMMNNGGFVKMGFNALGENSSFGDFGTATNLIEGIYAGDTLHDQNQLNPEWTHVGIGIKGLATDFVFGGRKR